jgi:hypothetical protein
VIIVGIEDSTSLLYVLDAGLQGDRGRVLPLADAPEPDIVLSSEGSHLAYVSQQGRSYQLRVEEY